MELGLIDVDEVRDNKVDPLSMARIFGWRVI